MINAAEEDRTSQKAAVVTQFCSPNLAKQGSAANVAGSPEGQWRCQAALRKQGALGRFWLFSLFFAAEYQPSDNC
jgi:hypothetical protein